jgi:hypothetical protein
MYQEHLKKMFPPAQRSVRVAVLEADKSSGDARNVLVILKI